MATETVRFSQVVEKAGQPESYILWTKPEQDKAFTAFLRQNRVMTVHQETVGAKADYGTVGYTEDRHRSLLIFPKSLKRFEGKRIIGIKYEELKGAEPKTKSPPKKAAPLPKKPQPKPGPKKKSTPPPPRNQIPFPQPEVVKPDKPPENKLEVGRVHQPEKVEDPAEEVASLKTAVKKALEALSKDKPVTAFNLLKAAIEPD